MPSPAFIRFARSSAERSAALAQSSSGAYPHEIELECAQVPAEFDVDSIAWLWLGSDNNKGAKTNYAQGIRGLGRCRKKEALGGRRFNITLDQVYLLPRTISKVELLQISPETYARGLVQASIVGLNNYASQVVQLLSNDELATISALIARALPKAREEIFRLNPEAASIELFPRQEILGSAAGSPPPTSGTPANLPSEIPDDDPVFQQVKSILVDDGMGGALLLGPPGTGKSWYARQIARKLTGGEPHRVREVQFHPSYQYEDFVEGYVPDGQEGFRLADKHLLQMIEIAAHTDGPVVLVIDEFSRSDPGRVLGETMTYMEGSLRGVAFYLPSGRKTSIPPNLLFLATMNPGDRSVDEIDAAMDRRWGKISLKPDVGKARDLLIANGMLDDTLSPILTLFVGIQDHLELGHAFLRTVRDRESMERVWDTQIRFIVAKRFRFDADALDDINSLWEKCLEVLKAKESSQNDAERRPAPETDHATRDQAPE